MENRITQLLNIKYPIIQGGMVGISESQLVSVVSNAYPFEWRISMFFKLS